MLVSVVTPRLLLWYGGWTFIGFGLTSIIGTLFVSTFMKETKGLTSSEVLMLYRPNQDHERLESHRDQVSEEFVR